MRLIVGLGSPGREYRETRHNVGFMVVEEFARRYALGWSQAPSQVPEAFVAKRYGTDPVLLAKPLTYMNLSGEAVAALARYYDVPAAELLIVVDEIALPFGRLRARARIGAGAQQAHVGDCAALGHRNSPALAGGRARGCETRSCRPRALEVRAR